MSVASAPAEQRVVLDNVAWSTWVSLLDEERSRRGRMVYDRGVLEIMSPSIHHENLKTLLARLFEAATEELDVDVVAAGALTTKREDLKRGIEPDECYYIAHASSIRTRTRST